MRLLCFNPHDDDVIIGAGGTLLKLLTKNWEVGYVYFTDGRHGSEIMSPEKTLKVRAEEARKEREFLVIKDYWEFGIEDGTLEKLDNEQIKELQNRVLDIVKIFQPDTILIPSLSEMHPDHRTTHYIVNDAVISRKLKMPIMKFIVWSFPDFYKKSYDASDKILLVNIDKEFNRKVEAIKLHESQIKEGNYDKIVEHFNSYLALIFRAYKIQGANKAEVIGLFNRNDENKSIVETLMKDLDNPRDVTTVIHGRQGKKDKSLITFQCNASNFLVYVSCFH